METLIQYVAVWAVPMLVAVVLHELAHGVVAYRLGDPTAASRGRLTLNPLAHVDPIGTVVLPLVLVLAHAPFLLGYAKPVPVNFANLRRPKRDMAVVALAGPLMNLLLAVGSAVAFRSLLGLPLPAEGPLGRVLAGTMLPTMMILQNSVVVNVVLAVFNSLPILPLDGGRVLSGLLPRRQAIAFARLEPFGMMIVLMLVATNALGPVMAPVVTVLLRALL